MFYTCAFASSPHIMEDPCRAKGLEGPDTAKGPEVNVGAMETQDQGGAFETRNPRSGGPGGPRLCAFSYFEFFCIIFCSHWRDIALVVMFESSVFYTCAFASSLQWSQSVGGSRCSQRPRSQCWSQRDERPRWSRRDNEPQQSQRD